MLELSEADAFYCCTQCSYQAVWSFQLTHHLQRSHRDLDTTKLFHAIVEPEQYLSICCDSKSYYNKLTRCEHCIYSGCARNVENGNIKSGLFNEKFKSYLCNYCRLKTYSSINLIKHRDSCGNVTKGSRIRNTNSAASSAMQLKFEYVNSSGCAPTFDDSYQCMQCSFKTKSKRSLRNHGIVKHVTIDEANWYSCAQCSYRTAHKSYLKRHTAARHTTPAEIKWFTCTECSHRTKHKANLKGHHSRNHTTSDNIAWFHCSKCSYQTKDNATLKRHMLIHAGPEEIKWYRCSKCSYRAKDSGTLRRHMLTHAGPEEIKWFSCTECPYRGKERRNLTRHVNCMHSSSDKINWLYCTKCLYRTKERRYLKKHLEGRFVTPALNCPAQP